MTEVMTAKPSIVVDDVSKWFHKRSTRSFKDAFLNWVRRKPVRSQQFQALKNISFTIDEGESVAVMGLNGSGKSTTLKLVSGVLEPDEGTVLTRGRVAGLIEVGAGFHPDLTGRENVYLNAAILGMSEKEIDARFDDILAFSEIGDFIEQEVKHYSSGMFMRLAFSVAIHVELDVLLVDEVLSVGDAPFRKKCNEKLKELTAQGVTMMVVSHSAGQVKKLCSRGIVIRKGEIIFDGPIDDALEVLAENGKAAPVKKPAAAKPTAEAKPAVTDEKPAAETKPPVEAKTDADEKPTADAGPTPVPEPTSEAPAVAGQLTVVEQSAVVEKPAVAEPADRPLTRRELRELRAGAGQPDDQALTASGE